MSFIAGLIESGPLGRGDRLIEVMGLAQAKLAPDGIEVGRVKNARFAYGSVPASLNNRVVRSYWSPCDRTFVLFSGRIDNRQSLLSSILSERYPIGDAELVFRLYAQSGENGLAAIHGDFAVAIWEESRAQLTLARDITGQRPLHYIRSLEFIAFASMPQALLSLVGDRDVIDGRQLAEFVADIPRSGDRTFFRNISRVEPGHIVKIDPAGISSNPYWHLPTKTLQFRNDAEYVEGLRSQLGQATRSRLSGAGHAVGAQLSSGLDSGGVAATAALEMIADGGRVIAFTSAPRRGFRGPLPRGRIADEYALAKQVVDLHPNMEQVVVREEGVSPLAIINRDSRLFGEPLGLACNQVWWAGINDAAKNAGLNVMLTGESGNNSFSAGGIETLSQFLRVGQVGRFVSEAIAAQHRGIRWRGIAYASVAPWMPARLWSLIQRLHWGPSTASEGTALLSSQFRDTLGNALNTRSAQPGIDQRRARAIRLQSADPGVFRLGTFAQWGIEERDPTSDRALIEFCLALPADQLLRDGLTRSITRRALSDRLPSAIIHGPRGYQGADWYERIDPLELAQRVVELGSHIKSLDVLDQQALLTVISSWPAAGWETGAVISRFRYGALRAVSAAVFASEFQSGDGAAALRGQAAPAIRFVDIDSRSA